ncbi:hypothetical protein H0H87_004675 [Tephrocybe sp. NHM501043]|nr:hypothetical protein H0H87_004675 [Tephrocybe sp. NHM501043]
MPVEKLEPAPLDVLASLDSGNHTEGLIPTMSPDAEKRLVRKMDLLLLPLFAVASVDIPSNLALKRLGSSWVAAMITAFGVVSISTAFIKSYAGLIVTRVFLGLAEGGTLVSQTILGLLAKLTSELWHASQV